MMHGGDDWMWHGNFGWGGWAMMLITMAVFWAVIISIVVLVIRYLARDRKLPRQEGKTSRSAEELLAQRYARGELDDDEYRRRVTVLREHQKAP